MSRSGATSQVVMAVVVPPRFKRIHSTIICPFMTIQWPGKVQRKV